MAHSEEYELHPEGKGSHAECGGRGGSGYDFTVVKKPLGTLVLCCREGNEAQPLQKMIWHLLKLNIRLS